MAVPKTNKLLAEQTVSAANPGIKLPPKAEALPDGPFKIKPVECFNEYVAVCRFRMETTKGGIELPEESKNMNEGIVIGVGPGTARNGIRVPSQLKIGDVIMFGGSVVQKINSTAGFYKGLDIVIITEFSALCKLPPVPFEIVGE